MYGSNMPSLADIAAVTKDNNDSFGAGNGWWILIILFALFGGWGNWGGYGGNGGQVLTEGSLQRGFDTQSIINKLNGLENGMCSLGYDLQGQISGVNLGVNNAVQNLQATMQANEIANMNRAFQAQQQLAQCCCDNKAAVAQVRYDMSTDTCALKTEMYNIGQSIMQNCNNNYRQLHDEMVAARMQAKDDMIADLRSKLQWQDLRASQSEQNEYLINRLNPCPVPAYTVPNPYTGTGYGCCGQNTGCC